MKRKISKDIQFDINYDRISSAINTLERLKEQYGDVLIDVRIEDNYGSESACTFISIEREETDAEYVKRLKNEELYEMRRREQYERMKKEYEGR